jgi:hypothetical protein
MNWGAIEGLTTTTTGSGAVWRKCLLFLAKAGADTTTPAIPATAAATTVRDELVTIFPGRKSTQLRTSQFCHIFFRSRVRVWLTRSGPGPRPPVWARYRYGAQPLRNYNLRGSLILMVQCRAPQSARLEGTQDIICAVWPCAADAPEATAKHSMSGTSNLPIRSRKMMPPSRGTHSCRSPVSSPI